MEEEGFPVTPPPPPPPPGLLRLPEIKLEETRKHIYKSLSLSLSDGPTRRVSLAFGLWSVRFPPVLVRIGFSNYVDFYIHVTPYPLRGKGGRREIFGPAGGSVTLIG